MTPAEGLPDQLVGIARRAAHAAAREHCRRRDAGIGTRIKGAAGDIVTAVDLEAERAALQVICAERPRDAVSGEERIADAAGDSAIRWVIDPLDGTTNYALGLPHYCSSVAAVDVDSREVLAAAIEAAALGVNYWAARGRGAYRESAGTVVQLERVQPRGLPRILLTGFSYDAEMRARQQVELPRIAVQFDDVRCLGSAALALCLVADRTVEAYVESDLYEYDWAAGLLIAREAGAEVAIEAAFRGPVTAGWA